MIAGALSAARILEAKAGSTEVAKAASHLFLIHVGEEVQARCRVNNLCQERVQQFGCIDIVPAGAEGVWHDDRPARMISLRFDPDVLGFDHRAVLGARHGGLTAVIRAIEHELTAALPDPFHLEGLCAAFAARSGAWLNGKPSSPPPLTERRLKLVTEYLAAHLADPIRVPALSSIVGLSASQFTSSFRAATGYSPHQYVTRKRLERARKLLRFSDLPIAEIAYVCGFSHQSHLTNRMKEQFGMPPAALRRWRAASIASQTQSLILPSCEASDS